MPDSQTITLEQIRIVVNEAVEGLATKAEVEALRAHVDTELARRPTDTSVNKIVNDKFSELKIWLTESIQKALVEPLRKIDAMNDNVGMMKVAVEHTSGVMDKVETLTKENGERVEILFSKANTNQDTGQANAAAIADLRVALYGDPARPNGPPSIDDQLKTIPGMITNVQSTIQNEIRDFKTDFVGRLANMTTNFGGELKRLSIEQAALSSRFDAIESEFGKYRKLAKDWLGRAINLIANRKVIGAVLGSGTVASLVIEFLRQLAERLHIVVFVIGLMFLVGGCR